MKPNLQIKTGFALKDILKGEKVNMSNQDNSPLNISGVIPRLSVKADLGSPRSESGIGALMPWAGRLWMVTYVSHKIGTGSGTGLYAVDENPSMKKRLESIVGTYANRMIHPQSNQLIITRLWHFLLVNDLLSAKLVRHDMCHSIKHYKYR